MGGSLPKTKKAFFGVLICAALTVYIILTAPNQEPQEIQEAPVSGIEVHTKGVSQRKIEEWWALRNATKNLSKLGEVLFLGERAPPENSQEQYQILVWKYGPTIENRHLKQYSSKRIDPFEYCPVKNCDITYKDSDIETADIVIIHLHRTKGLEDLPERRNAQQIWAFLTDESPHNTFLKSKNSLRDFNGVFNWSMSYRMDTDIPVPYGHTELIENPDITSKVNLVLDKRLDVLVAILGSNCGGRNHRWEYVRELQKYITVHVYGGCGTFKKECPGHFGSDCPAIGNYLFYLAFENSNCDEYITEKLWWNAYKKNSIPIVMGSSPDTYKKLLPVDSYINVDDFAHPQALASYLQRLVETGEYKNYYRWKHDFRVLNEHGYFQSKSFHYCRICQALNYNSREEKVYSDLENYWNVARDCHPSWNDREEK